MITDDMLLGVRKPARYTGGEWNASRKDFEKAQVKFALCFPDLYEVGMSNLGIRILYGILNRMEGVCCERFFSVDSDMEESLRRSSQELFSLESRKNLKDFDLVGFSLAYELSYTNVLAMLEAGSIPFESAERDSSFPLIIGGGPCVLNPEPVAAFFDLFVIGEAEEVLLEIVDCYRSHKQAYRSGALSKQELLLRLVQIRGVYVPSLYEVAYAPDGSVSAFHPVSDQVPSKVCKRFVGDLENSFFPLDWIVPYVGVVHDRVTVEIMRGCPNRCRFCQARSLYYPLRMRSAPHVISMVDALYRASGYEEVSLMGLSVSDYPQLKELIMPLISCYKEKGVSISLPSIKPKLMLGDLANAIAAIKKTGLTFAPEAATKAQRERLGKDFDEQDFFTTLEGAFRAGYQHVKLYFMTGLPGEDRDDLDNIVSLANQVSALRRKIDNRPAQVNVSVNTLIPKPHTPFQWLAMEELATMKEKQEYLRNRVRNKCIRLAFHDPQMSFLEAVFSRGDRRLATVIVSALRKGCRFDGWNERFNFSAWESAFKECAIDPGAYLRTKKIEETLAWDFIDTGVAKEHLIAEYKKACE